MTAELLAGLIAGYSIAIPVGPIGAYLVELTARTSLRVGAAAALGVASVDGVYAAAAMLGGAALADALTPALGILRWVSVAVLAVLAARTVRSGLRRPAEPAPGPVRALSPARAYATLTVLTAVNPSTVIYFVALVVGLRSSDPPSALGQALFVTAVVVASASWQLVLACGGALLGRLLTSARGRRWTALVSGALIGVLALRLAIG